MQIPYRQLIQIMSFAEIYEYYLYHQVEPFGNRWLGTGVIACMLSGKKNAKPQDYMPTSKGKARVRITEANVRQILGGKKT